MPTTDEVTFRSRAEVEQAAERALHQHGLYSLPVDPVVLANRMGIKVLNASFSDSTLAGMIAKRGENVTILVEQTDPPYRKRFTIAHELGHRVLHLERDGEFVDSTRDLFRDHEAKTEESVESRRAEIQANWFAAALLMPESLVRAQFTNTPDVERLARAFNVSVVAMGYRLEALGLG